MANTSKKKVIDSKNYDSINRQQCVLERFNIKKGKTKPDLNKAPLLSELYQKHYNEIERICKNIDEDLIGVIYIKMLSTPWTKEDFLDVYKKIALKFNRDCRVGDQKAYGKVVSYDAIVKNNDFCNDYSNYALSDNGYSEACINCEICDECDRCSGFHNEAIDEVLEANYAEIEYDTINE